VGDGLQLDTIIVVVPEVNMILFTPLTFSHCSCYCGGHDIVPIVPSDDRPADTGTADTGTAVLRNDEGWLVTTGIYS
jgi:hypothetical protein